MSFLGLGRRKQSPSGSFSAEQVDLAYRLLLGRRPKGDEAERAAAAPSIAALREMLLDTEEAQRALDYGHANADKKPLLLVGFPRGFTSQSYTILTRATGLGEHFPNAGEFLNLQRLRTFFPFAIDGRMRFYDTSDALYEKIAEAMGRVRNGYIVKDVVQPFHVLRFLEENPKTFNVIYVKRNLSHVAFSLMRREWGYVHRIAELHERFSQYTPLDVDRALEDFRHPVEVVRSLGYAARLHDYRDSAFLKQTREFEQAFARDSGNYDLEGLIRNADRRQVVSRFGAERAASS